MGRRFADRRRVGLVEGMELVECAGIGKVL